MSDAPSSAASPVRIVPLPRRHLRVQRLGRVEYGDGIKLMEGFARARTSGQLRDDVLLLLEHPAVITLGRGGKREHIVASPEALQAQGVEVVDTNRGGDVTYHGPGQLVAYPIIDLRPDRQDVHRYVRDLEEVVIRTLSDFGLATERITGWSGVWLGQKGDPTARKIAAVGVHLSRWVTTHGLALNVSTQLDHFGLIVPCGIREGGVTSMARELGSTPDMGKVEAALAQRMAEVFGAEVRLRGPDRHTISVSILRQQAGRIEALMLLRHPHRGGFWQPVTGTQETGETPLQTARREVHEESGLSDQEPVSLDYRHAFAFEGRRAHGTPRVFEETAFGLKVEGDPTITLDKLEHHTHRWAPFEEAVAMVPHLGLKRGLALARQKLFPT